MQSFLCTSRKFVISVLIFRSKQAHKKYSKKQDQFIFLLEKCTFLEEFMSIWIAKLTFLTCKWSICHTALVRAIIVHKYRTLHNALSQILMELMQKRLACVWSVFNYIMWLFLVHKKSNMEDCIVFVQYNRQNHFLRRRSDRSS